MKNNPSGISGFYRSDENVQHTVRTAVELGENIDPAALRKAVDIAIKRYDYYSVKFVREKGELLHSVLPNDKQIVMTEGITPVLLLSEQSNEHALAVNYEGSTVYFDIVHSITDETGILEFIKTTLYYYITEKYKTSFPADGIRTLDVPVTEEERRDPYLDIEPAKEETPKHNPQAAEPAVQWEEILPGCPVCKTARRMSVPEDEFMKYVKANGGTPAIVMSNLLAKTVYDLCEKLSHPFRTVLMKNYRDAVKAPKAHNNVLGNIVLNYTEQMRNMPMDKLCGVTRQMMDYQSSQEYMLNAVKNRLQKEQKILALGDYDAVHEAFQKSSQMNRVFVDLTVSYVHIQQLGALEPYIKSIFTYVDPAASHVLFEVNAVGGNFCITFLQEFAGNALSDGFAEQLRQAGIQATADDEEPLDCPNLKM